MIATILTTWILIAEIGQGAIAQEFYSKESCEQAIVVLEKKFHPAFAGICLVKTTGKTE